MLLLFIMYFGEKNKQDNITLKNTSLKIRFQHNLLRWLKEYYT